MLNWNLHINNSGDFQQNVINDNLRYSQFLNGLSYTIKEYVLFSKGITVSKILIRSSCPSTYSYDPPNGAHLQTPLPYCQNKLSSQQFFYFTNIC